MIPSTPSPSAVVRAMLAAATVVFAVIGFSVDNGAKFLTASGVFGIIWWSWDLIVDHVLTPFEYWMEDMMAGGALKYRSSKWSVSDRIALLHDRMERGKTRRLQVHAAIRLAEIYELQRKDKARARQVIEQIKARYPDAPEFDRF